EGLVAGLVDAAQVQAEEVDRDRAGDQHGAVLLDRLAEVVVVQAEGVVGGRAGQAEDLHQPAHDVAAGGDAAGRAGEDVVEHQGGDRQLGEEAAEGLLDHAVVAAADEQGRALDVHRADGVAEEHDGEDEPRRRRADGVLDGGPDVYWSYSSFSCSFLLLWTSAVLVRLHPFWASCSLVKIVYTGTPSAWAISFRRSRSRAKTAKSAGLSVSR